VWEERLHELVEFRKANGHVEVPRRWPNNRPLANWVVNQRRLIRTGQLPEARLRRLEELGIRWPSAEERSRAREREWDRMAEALAAFRNEHGDAEVPSDWPENPKLARWIVSQRHLLRAGSLRDDRRRRLEALGLEASRQRGRSRRRDDAWDNLYDALAEYRRAHGDCNVPKNWPRDPKLARWVARQRHHLKTQHLPLDRRHRLEELGFQRTPERSARARLVTEGPRDRAWRAMVDALTEFKAIEGHCDVPRRCPASPKLGRWVSAQRALQHAGRLSAARFRRLSELGFRWDHSTLAPLGAK